ncbi:MAG: LD-carboxypeptidase [Actinobacteria bacterium]|nr:LD-carboxypeptidase [Actinomycetota bacterium]
MLRSPIVPARVRPGDTVAIVSPSAPSLARFPHRAERGRAYLESLGLRVRPMPNAGGDAGWVSASPEARADDIHEAFRDEDVTVVLAAIGGNHSNQLLPHLDFDLIRSHPKIFQGYSDMTVLHWAFLRHAGLSTLYGPALVSELGEYPHVLPYTDRYLRAAWFGAEPVRFEPASEWTDEFLDWGAKADLVRPRRLRPGSGWRTLRPGTAEGPLLGGCLETVCWHLKGSAAWLDLDGAILLLETSEEAPSPAEVDAYLTDLEQLEVFERAAGLLFGRPYGYDEAGVEVLWRVVTERTAAAGLPVLADLDLGHTDPMLTLPLGAVATLDAGTRELRLESPP